MKNKITETIKTYDECAEDYFHKHSNINEIKSNIDFFIKKLYGKKILDVGCGPGRDLKYFLKHNLNVTGIDMSKNFLNIAQKNAPKAKLVKMDMRHLNFPNNYFDGIWVSASFLHIPKKNSKKTLLGLRRVLKNNGVMYIDVEKGTQEKIIRKKKYGNRPRLISFYTKKEIEKLFKKCRLSILREVIEKRRYGWIKILATKQ